MQLLAAKQAYLSTVQRCYPEWRQQLEEQQLAGAELRPAPAAAYTPRSSPAAHLGRPPLPPHLVPRGYSPSRCDCAQMGVIGCTGPCVSFLPNMRRSVVAVVPCVGPRLVHPPCILPASCPPRSPVPAIILPRSPAASMAANLQRGMRVGGQPQEARPEEGVGGQAAPTHQQQPPGHAVVPGLPGAAVQRSWQGAQQAAEPPSGSDATGAGAAVEAGGPARQGDAASEAADTAGSSGGGDAAAAERSAASSVVQAERAELPAGTGGEEAGLMEGGLAEGDAAAASQAAVVADTAEAGTSAGATAPRAGDELGAAGQGASPVAQAQAASRGGGARTMAVLAMPWAAAALGVAGGPTLSPASRRLSVGPSVSEGRPSLGGQSDLDERRASLGGKVRWPRACQYTAGGPRAMQEGGGGAAVRAALPTQPPCGAPMVAGPGAAHAASPPGATPGCAAARGGQR